MASRILVDQHDLQGNILAGYGYDHSLYVVLRVTDPDTGRRWLREIVDSGAVTTAVPFPAERRPDATLNIALTHDGLRGLGLSEDALRSFPAEYRHGMAARAELLGDDGPDAPARWEAGLRPGEPHVLMTVTAQRAEVLAERRRAIEERASGERAGAHIVHQVVCEVLRHPDHGTVAREHFGFADGLAQPSIEGFSADDPDRPVGPWRRPGKGTPVRRGWKHLAPGEFVLGYPDEAADVAKRPIEPLRRSGSYLVLRKLRQNVALFNRYLLESAGGDEREARLLAAKVVGRWHDGTPLVISPEEPERPRPGRPDNDFRYGDDRDGFRCPIGAHIRRANPRDALGFGGRLTSRHRMIRRGMPYGRPPVDPLVEDGLERGLMFVCYQADIERQFEVVQGRWLSDGDAFGLAEERDFLLGGEDPVAKMTIQGDQPRFLTPRRTFVTNRGGAYFFAPGIAALRAIADGV